jgi:hypothetical protein
LEKDPKEKRVLKRKEFLRGKNSQEKRILKRKEFSREPCPWKMGEKG